MSNDKASTVDSSTKSTKSAKKPVKKSAKKPNKALKYFKDLKAEIKKVVWPSKKQIINNTGVVLITLALSAVVIAGLDLGLKTLMEFILSKA